MFKNIGGKIKGLATVISIIGIAVSVIYGIILILGGSMNSGNGAMVGLGFVVMIGGSLAAWIGSFLAYGFGELIENTTVIAELMAKADAEKEHR